MSGALPLQLVAAAGSTEVGEKAPWKMKVPLTVNVPPGWMLGQPITLELELVIMTMSSPAAVPGREPLPGQVRLNRSMDSQSTSSMPGEGDGMEIDIAHEVGDGEVETTAPSTTSLSLHQLVVDSDSDPGRGSPPQPVINSPEAVAVAVSPSQLVPNWECFSDSPIVYPARSGNASFEDFALLIPKTPPPRPRPQQQLVLKSTTARLRRLAALARHGSRGRSRSRSRSRSPILMATPRPRMTPGWWL